MSFVDDLPPLGAVTMPCFGGWLVGAPKCFCCPERYRCQISREANSLSLEDRERLHKMQRKEERIELASLAEQRRIAARRPLLLIDGNHLLHRVLHVNELSVLNRNKAKQGSKRRRPGRYGGVFGFLRSLRSAMQKFDALRAVVIWDDGKSERRLAIYPGYKKRSAPTAEYLEHRRLFDASEPIVREVLVDLGVRSLSVRGKEGDDVLLEARDAAIASGFSCCVVVSEDGDFLQMVTDDTMVYFPIKDMLVTRNNFKDMVGMPVTRVVHYRAIVGDKSDKIEGVRGAGMKTALQVVNEMPSIKFTEMKDFCAAHSSAYVRRVAGMMDVVMRNFTLMRLGREEFTDQQLTRIRRRVSKPLPGDLLNALNTMQEMRLDTITQNYSNWSLPFVRAGANWGGGV